MKIEVISNPNTKLEGKIYIDTKYITAITEASVYETEASVYENAISSPGYPTLVFYKFFYEIYIVGHNEPIKIITNEFDVYYPIVEKNTIENTIEKNKKECKKEFENMKNIFLGKKNIKNSKTIKIIK